MSIAVGWDGMVFYALMTDGTVWEWGYNWGAGNGGDLVPFKVPGLEGVASIAAGYSAAYALLTDGTVRAWGNNGGGALGNGGTDSSRTPVQVLGLKGVTSIAAAGANTAFAVLADGTVRAWGINSAGQLGSGGALNSSSVPVQVTGLSGVVSIATTFDTEYALLADGTVRAWGSNQNGRLGDGTMWGSSIPVKVKDLSGVASLRATAGDVYGPTGTAYALMTDGTVRAWGYNGNGQLGDGTTADRNIPVRVKNLTGVTSLAL